MKPRWPLTPLAQLIQQRKDPITLEDDCTYRRVTVSLHAQGITLRDEVTGADVKTKKQFPLKAHDLLVAEIDAKVGGYGIVPPDLAGAVVSSHYFIYEVDRQKLDPRYVGHWLKTESPLLQVEKFIRGALNYAAIRPYHFPQIRIPLPQLPEQERIAGRLDRFHNRIAEARRLRDELQDEQHEFLLSLARKLAASAPREPLQQVAPLLRRPIEIRRDGSYPELGIRSFGKGTFHKPTLTGEEVGSKRLYQIKPGDLLFSNVFSWEGAIAVVQPEDAGRCGSHRFITCVPDPAKATADFLCHWFLTEEGMSHIRTASPGAAGRNRTLGIKKLMAIPVPVPPLPAQQRFSEFRRCITQACALHQDLPAELDAFEKALLDRAFNGNL